MISDKQTWDTCPHELLLSIFRYLEPKDLIRASSTCKNWRQVHQDPSLSRKWTFQLDKNSCLRPPSVRNHVKVCKYYGHHMRQVRIECPENDLHCTVNFINSVLLCLANKSQGAPVMERFHISLPPPTCQASKMLTSIIGDFLKSQTSLRELRIYSNPVSYHWQNPQDLLDCFLRAGSAPHIQLLDLRIERSVGFGTDPLWTYYVQLGIQLRDVFSRFYRLTELGIGYSFLCAATIKATCQILKDLHSLVIYYFSADEWTGQQISTRDWLEAVGLCSRLRVTLHDHGLHLQGARFLVAGMPLTTFTYSFNFVALIVEECASLLETLSRLFPDTLESVILRDETDHYPYVTYPKPLNVPKEMFINCIRKCPRLLRLAVFRPLMTEVLRDEIRQELLHTFHLEQDVLVII